MMLIEHLAVVFVLVTVAYVIVLLMALGAQFLDVDHTCEGCSVSDRANLLLNCGKAKNLGEFGEKCYTLHRGVFHNVNLLYLEAMVTLIMVGLVTGHCIHLMADGYDIVGLVWIRNIIMRFI
jgi:hypothetical protein